MQIEHHLFPRVPRHNLRAVRELVRPFCAKWNIPYCESSFFAAVKDVIKSLADVTAYMDDYKAKRQLAKTK